MSEHYRMCESDEDYARYTQFYIRHYQNFSKSYTLTDALLHILGTVSESRIMLILSESEQVIGWGQYRFLDQAELDNSLGATVFIDSVIVDSSNRSNRLFVRGFRQLLQFIEQDNPNVQHITFNALANNDYLNRLYAKFATAAGVREDTDEREHVFTARYDHVKQYLQAF